MSNTAPSERSLKLSPRGMLTQTLAMAVDAYRERTGAQWRSVDG